MSEPNKALLEIADKLAVGSESLAQERGLRRLMSNCATELRALASSEPGDGVAWSLVDTIKVQVNETDPADIQPGDVPQFPIYETRWRWRAEMRAITKTAHPPTAAAPVGIVGERGDVSWRSDQILPVGTKLYAHPRTAATQPDSLCAKHLANCTFPKCDCTEDTQPEQVRELDESALEQRVAKAIADVIGHGMSEKCYDMAKAALAALREPRA